MGVGGIEGESLHEFFVIKNATGHPSPVYFWNGGEAESHGRVRDIQATILIDFVHSKILRSAPAEDLKGQFLAS